MTSVMGAQLRPGGHQDFHFDWFYSQAHGQYLRRERVFGWRSDTWVRRVHMQPELTGTNLWRET